MSIDVLRDIERELLLLGLTMRNSLQHKGLFEPHPDVMPEMYIDELSWLDRVEKLRKRVSEKINEK